MTSNTTEAVERARDCPFCGITPDLTLGLVTHPRKTAPHPCPVKDRVIPLGTWNAEALAATQNPESDVKAGPCLDCNDRGVIETGEMEKGPSGWGYVTVLCHCEEKK